MGWNRDPGFYCSLEEASVSSLRCGPFHSKEANVTTAFHMESRKARIIIEVGGEMQERRGKEGMVIHFHSLILECRLPSFQSKQVTKSHPYSREWISQ